MIFNKKMLNEMVSEIELRNNDKWYNVIQKKIDRNEMSSISDYDDYGQWMFVNHRNLMKEKPLYNTGLHRKLIDSFENLEKKYSSKYKTISFHSYIK